MSTPVKGNAIGEEGDLVLVRLASVIGAETARALIARARQPSPSPLVILYSFEVGAVGIPDDAARSALVEFSRVAEGRFAAASLAVPDGGFATAIARAFLSGVRAAARAKLPIAVHTSLPSAIDFLRTHAPPSTAVPSDLAIQRALAELSALAR